jgi:predicted nucleic acid-binding protein
MDLLLDSTVLVDTLRSRNGRKELLAQLVEAGHRLTTTALNMAEIYAGMRSGEETRTSLLLDSLVCHSLDAETGKQAGLLKNVWAKKGKTISLPDAIVAAIAIERGCTLLTDNRKDFPMPEIRLFQLP